MTGPEHYREAERLMTTARETFKILDGIDLREKADATIQTAPVVANLLAQAHVHATLALVAATRGPGDTAWFDVLLADDDERREVTP